MQSIEALSEVLTSIASTLQQLPPQLAPDVNLPAMGQQLVLLSTSLQPTATLLAPAQQELLLSNTTWVAENLGQLSGFLGMIPEQMLADMPASQIEQLLVIGSTKYDVTTAWSPDAFAIIILFGLAFVYKVATLLLLSPRALRRCASLREREDGVSMMPEVAKGILMRPVRSFIAHALNLTIATICFVLQMCAWRLLKVPGTDTYFDDVVLLNATIKLLLIGYASELLSADVHWEIWLHHTMTVLLLVMGEFSAFYTHSPLFFRFGAWLLLQATAEQTTYFSMACYHLYTFYHRQDARPVLQRKCLWLAWLFMETTKYTCYLQKLVPAAFALYWLGMSWSTLEDSSWGRFYLAWATILLTCLIPLQMKFCDDMFSLASYFRTKLDGTKPTSANHFGPVMRFLRRKLLGRRPPTRKPTVDSVVSSSGESRTSSEERLRRSSHQEHQDLEAGGAERPLPTVASEVESTAPPANGFWTYEDDGAMLSASPRLSSRPGYFDDEEPGAERFSRNAFMGSGVFLPEEEEPQHFFLPFIRREDFRGAQAAILHRASVAKSRALESASNVSSRALEGASVARTKALETASVARTKAVETATVASSRALEIVKGKKRDERKEKTEKLQTVEES